MACDTTCQIDPLLAPGRTIGRLRGGTPASRLGAFFADNPLRTLTTAPRTALVNSATTRNVLTWSGTVPKTRMIPPKVPTGGAEGSPSATTGYAARSMTGWVSWLPGGARSVVSTLALLRHQAAMLRVGQVDDKGPPGDEIAEVVERAPDLVIPVGAASATGAGLPFVVPAAPAGLGLGEIFDTEDAYGRVAAIFSGPCHGH